MKAKYLFYALFVLLVVSIISCAPAQQPSTAPAPDSKASEPQQAPSASPTATKPQISEEVKELLGKSSTRVKSVYYKYRGPETGTNFHEFYVKGSKIRYKPYREIKSLDRPESYDSIFIDTIGKTAQSYCTEAYCAYKGKKADLNYNDAYIKTVFDWIKVASAEKIGEEVIDSRSTWKLNTNLGTLWVDTFYGVPLKAESGGKTYRFEQISVNNVQDSDVVPQ